MAQTLIAVGTLIIAGPIFLVAFVCCLYISGCFAQGIFCHLTGRDQPTQPNPVHMLLLGLAVMAVVGFIFP